MAIGVHYILIIICYVRKPIYRCGLARVVSLYKRAGPVDLVKLLANEIAGS